MLNQMGSLLDFAYIAVTERNVYLFYRSWWRWFAYLRCHCAPAVHYTFYIRSYINMKENKDWQNGAVQLRGHGRSLRLRGLESCEPHDIQRVKNVRRTDLRRSSALLWYVQPAATGRTLQSIVMAATGSWAGGLTTRCSHSVAILRTGCSSYVRFWTDGQTDRTALVQTVPAQIVLIRLYKYRN